MGYHSPEYTHYIQSEEWQRKSRLFRALFFNRCVLFPWLKAKQAHHMTYDGFKNEFFWIHCVGLSESGHNIIHIAFLWKNKAIRRLVNAYLRLAVIVLFLPVAVISMTFWLLGLVFGTKKPRKRVMKMTRVKSRRN